MNEMIETNKKKLYVVGFLFHDNLVALINKNRPEWQRGKLNGIGGHIEDKETPLEAMRREFKEEADADIDSWEQYCTVIYHDAVLYFFRTFGDYEIKTKTDERVWWYPIDSLPINIIPNLHWLIPLALYQDKYMEKILWAGFETP